MLPVIVEPINGRFQASLPGSTTFRFEADTKEQAVAALRADLQARYARGELVWVNVPKMGVSDLAGQYTPSEAEAIREIAAEAYRLRDEQKALEFPE